jgi:hypothetical protein
MRQVVAFWDSTGVSQHGTVIRLHKLLGEGVYV